MLLGWHYRWEYANDYGANQYLASLGFVVLSVDYRLSVGYGQAFQFADNTGARGAAEYRDILAAGKYLQSRADVDPARIGAWGGSYGGYLTALALGRNSDVFAAGVDMHGVHDRLPALNPVQFAHAVVGDGLVEADVRQALKIQFESSPIAAVSTWKSPVLLIHGDDDRTVDFHQTVDLERRLNARASKSKASCCPTTCTTRSCGGTGRRRSARWRSSFSGPSSRPAEGRLRFRHMRSSIHLRPGRSVSRNAPARTLTRRSGR